MLSSSGVFSLSVPSVHALDASQYIRASRYDCPDAVIALRAYVLELVQLIARVSMSHAMRTSILHVWTGYSSTIVPSMPVVRSIDLPLGMAVHDGTESIRPNTCTPVAPLDVSARHMQRWHRYP